MSGTVSRPLVRSAWLSLTPVPCVAELRFDVRLMQRVPYEGVSRMQTVRRGRSAWEVWTCHSCAATHRCIRAFAEHQAPPP